MKLMTYNVHGGVGSDGRLSLERIAEVIAQEAPDVVALQEVDVCRMRSGMVDQAAYLARLLGMTSCFHPAFCRQDEQYGDAILARWPAQVIRKGELPTVRRPLVDETRGALWVEVECGQETLQVINTHLGLGRLERKRQAEALLGPEWMRAAHARGPAVLCGDFNSLPGRRVHSLLAAELRDAQRAARGRHTRTFSTRFPWATLDHVFVTADVEVLSTNVPRTPLTRAASDHFPLVVELRIA